MATLDSISVTKNDKGTPVVILQVALDGEFTDQDASTIKDAINGQLVTDKEAKVAEAVRVIGKLDVGEKAAAIAAAQTFKEAAVADVAEVEVIKP